MWNVFRLTHDRFVYYNIPDESFGYGAVIGRSYWKGFVTLERDIEEGESAITFPGRYLTSSSVF